MALLQRWPESKACRISIKCILMSNTSREQYRRVKGRYELKKNGMLQTRQQFIFVHSNIICCGLHTVMAPLPYQNTKAVYKARDKNAKLDTQ
jgi:hypothetical protein